MRQWLVNICLHIREKVERAKIWEGDRACRIGGCEWGKTVRQDERLQRRHL